MQTQQAGREIQCHYMLHQCNASELSAELYVHMAHSTAPWQQVLRVSFWEKQTRT